VKPVQFCAVISVFEDMP